MKSRKRRFKQDTSQDDPSDTEKENEELRLCLTIAPDEDKESEEDSTMALELIRFIKKSWLVQDQTILGKDYSNLLIADSLLKTIWFINAPCYDNEALASPNTNDEELSIPEQTATGKGTSNPLMAGSLPKTTKPTYGYIKNHKKTVKNGQARTRESEEYKKKPKNQSRSQKSQALSQIQSTMVKQQSTIK
ncbi:hypothetical protein Tco_0590842 [Tanacetum coccineum]